MIHNVARILELVVPLMEHPSETFLASLEEDLMRLTVKHGQTVGTKIVVFACSWICCCDCSQRYAVFAVISFI